MAEQTAWLLRELCCCDFICLFKAYRTGKKHRNLRALVLIEVLSNWREATSNQTRLYCILISTAKCNSSTRDRWGKRDKRTSAHKVRIQLPCGWCWSPQDLFQAKSLDFFFFLQAHHKKDVKRELDYSWEGKIRKWFNKWNEKKKTPFRTVF